MNIRVGRVGDFTEVRSLVAAAIAEPFYRPDLTPVQRAGNQHIIDIAERCCQAAPLDDNRAIFSTLAEDGSLAGFVIADRTDPAMPEIDWLIVSPRYQGRGIAAGLMRQALDWIGPGKPIKLGVIHFNARAIAFYRKFGFVETGEIVGRHEIPRTLMRRPAMDG
jgi:ribosomal protein S18 acetylase RimI-like enzyme